MALCRTRLPHGDCSRIPPGRRRGRVVLLRRMPVAPATVGLVLAGLVLVDLAIWDRAPAIAHRTIVVAAPMR